MSKKTKELLTSIIKNFITFILLVLFFTFILNIHVNYGQLAIESVLILMLFASSHADGYGNAIANDDNKKSN